MCISFSGVKRITIDHTNIIHHLLSVLLIAFHADWIRVAITWSYCTQLEGCHATSMVLRINWMFLSLHFVRRASTPGESQVFKSQLICTWFLGSDFLLQNPRPQPSMNCESRTTRHFVLFTVSTRCKAIFWIIVANLNHCLRQSGRTPLPLICVFSACTAVVLPFSLHQHFYPPPLVASIPPNIVVWPRKRPFCLIWISSWLMWWLRSGEFDE